jgi:hypothetical protein
MKVKCPKCEFVLADDMEKPSEFRVDIDTGPMSPGP